MSGKRIVGWTESNLIDQGRFDEAIEAARSDIDLTPSERAGLTATAYLRAGEVAKAKAVLDGLNFEEGRFLLAKLDLAVAVGDSTEAGMMFSKLRDMPHWRESATISIASGLLKRHQAARALSWLERNRPNDGFSTRTVPVESEAMLRTGRRAEALELARKGFASEKTSEQHRRAVALAASSLGLDEEAEAMIAPVLEHNPAIGTLQVAAKVYLAVGRLERARVICDRLVHLAPCRAGGWALRAQLRARTGDVLGAIEDIATALNLDPLDEEMARMHVRLLIRRCRFRAALRSAFRFVRAQESETLLDLRNHSGV